MTKKAAGLILSVRNRKDYQILRYIQQNALIFHLRSHNHNTKAIQLNQVLCLGMCISFIPNSIKKLNEIQK
jgi:hypothetical protein